APTLLPGRFCRCRWPGRRRLGPRYRRRLGRPACRAGARPRLADQRPRRRRPGAAPEERLRL
ncbi:MAG: hypothetical protein AVDCRST_MAG27-2725, partial [uncultured Craurococcus sp.]